MLTLILLLFQLTFTCQAQPLYQSCFENCLSLPYGDQYSAHVIVAAKDGNGSLSLINAGEYLQFDTCFYIVQVDSTGNLLWSRSVCIDHNEIPDSSPDDSVVIAKYTYPTEIISDGQLGYYVSALRDSVTRTFDPDLGYYVSTGSRSFVLYKLNASGELLWSKRPSGNTTLPLQKIVLHDDHIYGLLYNQNGSVISPMDSSFLVMKMDTTGTLIWTKKVFTSGIVGNTDIAMNANSMVVVATINDALNAVSMDLDGTIEWAKVFGSGFQDRLAGVVQMGDGYAIGFNRVDLAPHPIMLVIDHAGELLSSRSLRADSSFFLRNFISYDMNSALMYQTSSVTTNDPYQVARKGDIWIIDQSNDVLLHERDYQSVAIGYFSFYRRDLVDLNRSASGLLFLHQNRSYYHPTSSTMTLPFITQADSIGNTCTHRPALASNDSVSIENIQESIMSLTVNDVSFINQSNYAINELFAINVWSECTASVGVSDPGPVLRQVSIFPMPFSNTLNITANQDKSYRLTLFDASSRIVGSYRFHGSTTLSTSDLGHGLYFYQIFSDNDLIQSGKVLKL